MMIRSRSWAILAVAGCAVLATAAPMASAAVVRSILVIPLAGGIIDEGCTEPLLYTGGEVHFTEQEVTNASGGVVTQLHIRTVHATAVGLETGVEYVDRTSIHQGVHGNGTFFESQFADGSHGVNITARIRLSSPGSDAPELVIRDDFHLRRVEGLDVEPRMVLERSFTSCE